MRRRVRWGAPVLALVLGLAGGAVPASADTEPGNAPRSVDCWLLDGDRLAQARDQGLCGDAFSRNSGGTAPPVVATDGGTAGRLGEAAAATVPPPPRKPAAPAAVRKKAPAVKAGKRVPVPSAHRTARPVRGDEGDFFTRFGKDWNDLVRAVEGVLSGKPPPGKPPPGKPPSGHPPSGPAMRPDRAKGRGSAGGHLALPPVMDHRGR